MVSIFKDVPSPLTFWTSAQTSNPDSHQTFISGILLTQEPGFAQPRPHFTMLTKLFLHQCRTAEPDSPLLREAQIRWVTVLPFTEFVESHVRYGFSLKYRDEKVDFYVGTEEELELWVRALEQSSILQDIEDDYSIGDVLGTGGQSIVYAGTDLDTGARVAIKCFDKQLLRESDKRFIALVHEVEVLRDLSHPRIVALYKVYESITHVQLVMEFIPGQELFECLSLAGAFTEQEARGFMLNMLEVLKCMEERNVVHRDLKPENIILTDPNDKTQFKLIDFGFATKYMGRELHDTCGSPGYVAPEIILKHQHGPTVDIYSAGIIFYILLCGYSPFYSTKKAEVIKKNAKNEIPYQGVWMHMDSRLVKMVKVMTNFNAKQRTSAGELMNFLAGGLSAVDSVMRRSSVFTDERLPPLRKPLNIPLSPQPSYAKSPGASTPSTPVVRGSLSVKKPQNNLRWPNPHS